MAAGVNRVAYGVFVLERHFLEDGSVGALPVPDQQARRPVFAEAAADGDVAVLEGEGVAVVGADRVHDAHDAAAGDDARLLLDAVLEALVQDHVVVLLVAADLDDLGRDVVEAPDAPAGHPERIHPAVVRAGAKAVQLLAELLVLEDEVLVRAFQAEVAGNRLRTAPDGPHHPMRGAGDPDALEFRVVVEHLQSSNLQ